jgi:hypothetical protein
MNELKRKIHGQWKETFIKQHKSLNCNYNLCGVFKVGSFEIVFGFVFVFCFCFLFLFLFFFGLFWQENKKIKTKNK